MEQSGTHSYHICSWACELQCRSLPGTAPFTSSLGVLQYYQGLRRAISKTSPRCPNETNIDMELIAQHLVDTCKDQQYEVHSTPMTSIHAAQARQNKHYDARHIKKSKQRQAEAAGPSENPIMSSNPETSSLTTIGDTHSHQTIVWFS